MPIPAAPVLMAAGGLAAAGRLSLPGAIGLGVLATLIADLIWYAVGRLRGAQVLGLLCRISLEPDSCVRRTENVFLRHGLRFLLFAKFVPGLGTVGPPLAGAVGVGVLRFSLYSAIGAFLWVGAWMVLGYGAGEAVERVVARAGQLGAAVAVTLGLIIVGYVVVKWVQRRRFLRSLRIARISPDELARQLAAGDSRSSSISAAPSTWGSRRTRSRVPSGSPSRTRAGPGGASSGPRRGRLLQLTQRGDQRPGWRCCSSAEASPGSGRWPAGWTDGASAGFRWNLAPSSRPPRTDDSSWTLRRLAHRGKGIAKPGGSATMQYRSAIVHVRRIERSGGLGGDGGGRARTEGASPNERANDRHSARPDPGGTARHHAHARAHRHQPAARVPRRWPAEPRLAGRP